MEPAPTEFQFRQEVACWKVRTCNHCGCEYRYQLKARRTGTGPTRHAAREDSVIAAKETVASRKDLSPCPRCGSYQPDMIGTLRLRWHGILVLANVPWIVPMICVYNGQIPRWLAIGAIAMLASGIIAAHAWALGRYPIGKGALTNKRLLLDEIRVVMDSGRKPEEWQKPASVRVDRRMRAAFLLAIGSLALLGASDALLWTTGWPRNHAWHPEVAGPGDSVWTHFPPNKIASVRGLWGAESRANMQVVNDLKVIPLESATRKQDWGDRIEFKSDQEVNQNATPWVRVYLPKDEQFAGKTVRVNMTLDMVLPVATGRNEFVPRKFQVEHTELIEIAPPHAGLIFKVVWYSSMMAPLAILIGMQVVLLSAALRLRRTDSTKAVEACDQPSEETPPKPTDTSIKES